MKLHLNIAITVAAVIFVMTAASCSKKEGGFVHPGIDMTLSDLEYVRDQIKAGDDTLNRYFGLLKESTSPDFVPKPQSRVIRGPYNKPDIGGTALFQSARQSYNNALMWFITGEEAYAKKAIEIIDAWSGTLRSFDENDTKLIIALTGYDFCNAAEILRYTYKGWTEKNTESASRLFKEVFYPCIRYYYPEANGNWDGAMMHTLLSIAVFMDDKTMFDDAIHHFLTGPCNGSLLKYVHPSGQCQEMTRDMGHVQLGLIQFSGAARVAYTQGVDLFEVADKRLALGLEYAARWITGGEVHCYGPASERGRLRYTSGFDWFLKLYNSKGVDMPALRELVARAKGDPLLKLTSYSKEFLDTPYELKPVLPSAVAYPAGALETEEVSSPDAVILRPGDDIQACLDANAGSGKTILLKAGEYKVAKSINIPSGITLKGEGLGTVLVCEPTIFNSAITMEGDVEGNVTFENFVLEGAWDHAPGFDPNTGRWWRTGRLSNDINGITVIGKAGSTKNFKFKNLTVINFSRHGVYCSDVDGIVVENCDFTENGSMSIPGERLTHNIMVQNCSGVRISDSRLDTSTKGAGVFLKCSTDIGITSCEIARNAWHGVIVQDSGNVTVSGCLIEANNGDPVHIDDLLVTSKNISVKDCKIQHNNFYAITTNALP